MRNRYGMAQCLATQTTQTTYPSSLNHSTLPHPEKGGILVLNSMNVEKNGLILMSSVLLGKWGFIWAEKSAFYHKKRIHFGLKNQCFIMKKGSFWAEKSVFCHKKGGNFQTGEQGWVPLFPVSEGARQHIYHIIPQCQHRYIRVSLQKMRGCGTKMHAYRACI